MVSEKTCKEINTFLEGEKFATIACLMDDGSPYCFNCMYLFNKDSGLLYFKSSASSKHVACIMNDSRVSGTILPVKPDLLALKGVQFSGNIINVDDGLYAKAGRKYHLAFPLAVSMPGKVYVIKLKEIKLTDNTICFGRKFTWVRDNELDPIPFV